MSNKSTLQEHNTLLQQAIDKANALPNAGGGSAVETCTVTFPEHTGYLWYTNATGNYVVQDLVTEGDTFTVQKNTIIRFTTDGDVPQLIPTVYGDGILVYDDGYALFFAATGDCTIAV